MEWNETQHLYALIINVNETEYWVLICFTFYNTTVLCEKNVHLHQQHYYNAA